MKTYAGMNEKIVGILRVNNDNPACLYAAGRIEELEQLLASTIKALDVSGRFTLQARKERDVYFQIAADCIGDIETEDLARKKLAEMEDNVE